MTQDKLSPKYSGRFTFIVGIVFLGEQISAMRIAAAVLIVSGLVMMKLASH